MVCVRKKKRGMKIASMYFTFNFYKTFNTRLCTLILILFCFFVGSPAWTGFAAFGFGRKEKKKKFTAPGWERNISPIGPRWFNQCVFASKPHVFYGHFFLLIVVVSVEEKIKANIKLLSFYIVQKRILSDCAGFNNNRILNKYTTCCRYRYLYRKRV